jgi:hypothetical protein
MKRFRIKASTLIISIVLVTTFLAFINHTKGSSSNINDSKQPPEISYTNAVLSEGWFDQYITELQEPANLQLPLKELWRINVPPLMNAAVWQEFVFISYSKPDPNVNINQLIQQQKTTGKPQRIPMQHFTECYEIATGQRLWSVSNISGRFVVIPRYLLVLCSNEKGFNIAALDYKKGNIIKIFPYPIDANSTINKIRSIGVSSNYTEKWASDVRYGTLKSIYSGKSPVPLDINKWTQDDAHMILDIFSSGDTEYIMRHGSLKGSFLFPNIDYAVIRKPDHKLIYKSLSKDEIYWQQICTAGTLDSLLWNPPYVVIFSSRTSVTAYSIENGHPEWIYEFPASILNGGPVYRLASLTDGILLLTEPLTGIKESKNLWIIKLDPNGNELSKQELTVKSLYQKLTISNGYLVLWSNSEIVCYGHAEDNQTSQKFVELTDSTEEQRQLEIKKLHDEYEKRSFYERRFVCEKLGKLKDKSMLERVIADFNNAVGENPRSDYVDALGLLNDRRAIDVLIPLLDDKSFSVRNKVRVSLQRLTGLDFADLIGSTDWKQWWKTHKHLYMTEK